MEKNCNSNVKKSSYVAKKFLKNKKLDSDIVKKITRGLVFISIGLISIILSINVLKLLKSEKTENFDKVNEAAQVKSNEIYKFDDESSEYQPEILNLDYQQKEKNTFPQTDLVELNFLATTEQHYSEINFYQVNCSHKGYNFEKENGNEPLICGVAFTDELVPQNEIINLKHLAEKAIDEIGETTASNRESHNLQWVNLHNIFRKLPSKNLLTDQDFQALNQTSIMAKKFISTVFAIEEDNLFLTTVSQFTKYEQVTTFSEFKHVDKVRTPQLVVTSILWLSTVGKDFEGGRLEFLNGPNQSSVWIEPKMGRFAAWTSSYENPHGVQEMFYGQRYALILAFTVDKNFGHKDIYDLRTWSVVTKPSFYY